MNKYFYGECVRPERNNYKYYELFLEDDSKEVIAEYGRIDSTRVRYVYYCGSSYLAERLFDRKVDEKDDKGYENKTNTPDDRYGSAVLAPVGKTVLYGEDQKALDRKASTTETRIWDTVVGRFRGLDMATEKPLTVTTAGTSRFAGIE